VNILEEKRGTYYLKKEKEWRIKNRSIWLQPDDENDKFFQIYANRRKILILCGKYT
jgi:hypothetical protein